jgi:predicted GTPase
MSRWRIAVVLLLVAVPLLFLVGLASYRLWELGLAIYVWWPLSACVALGYFLGLYWLRQKRFIKPVDFSVPVHWTERDQAAWKLVEARAKQVAELQSVELQELQFYVKVAQDMALELARFYHPGASDPLGSLTIPEILAVAELAAHDLGQLVNDNVPGGHLLTINQWRWAKRAAEQATSWWRNSSNLYWLFSAVLSPIDTGLKYAASHVGMSRPLQLFQQDLIAWFHMAFVHRLGTYLIDLNSGRLRVGADRYRELKQQLEDGTAPAAPRGVEPPAQITLTILGQVKMGKSSFVNALLGEQRAQVDVVPATEQITRYDLRLPDLPTRLVLLDTVGYAHSGARTDEVRATQQAAQQSDLLVLVLHARSPARQADVELLEAFCSWFGGRPDLKMPPVLAVVTHIDLLSPALEWSPPYNWEEPRRAKEVQIAEALATVRDQFGTRVTAAVPVSTAEGKVYGIDEWFLPTMLELLGEARGVALLRCLRAEKDVNKMRRVFDQLLHVGRQVLQVWAAGRARRTAGS